MNNIAHCFKGGLYTHEVENMLGCAKWFVVKMFKISQESKLESM